MQNKKQTRELTYAQALLEATQQSMEKDSEVILIGEGVPDVKSIFGTTAGLMENFGNKRVFDMPLSENGLTGICIGAAISGMRLIMVHQRIDFTLLAMDQLINNAAKWHYLFNGQKSVPLVVRMIVGRGWGQGAQHSQSLQALFAHIPGLKVVMPSMPYDAKGMLISAIEDNNPVIFIEHRWLFHIKEHVPEEPYRVPLDKSKTIREGKHVTIAAISYMVIEAMHVADYLEKHGIHVTVISVHALNPLDVEPVLESVQKTGYLVVLDTACK
ncbi:MAG: alpha-ketoacid dehydrogenase subunit beta, partial [Parcubacteria group bacterium]|nr:alpha-ketoacid dehydrogenase subunit beta [Parcubacteria group bacterium]